MSLLSVVSDTTGSSFGSLADLPHGALDAIPVAIFVVNGDARLIRFNRHMADLWGKSPKLGDDPDQFFEQPITEGNVRSSALALVLQNGEPAVGVELTIERSGERLVMLANIEPLRDGAGTVCGAISCLQDVTSTKRLEKELRDSQSLLEGIVDATPECIKVVDAQGNLVQMNRAGLEMIGSATECDVLGASVFDVIAPEFRDEWKVNHQRVVSGERITWEFDIVGLDGTRRHMDTHAVPLALPNGEVAQLAITRDISQRKRDEAALHESSRQHRDVLEALPAAIYTTDRAGRITFYNQAAVDLAGRKPSIGSDTWCVTHQLYWPDGTFLPHDQCPMAITLKEQRPSHGEYEAVTERPDGRRVPFIPYATPLFDAQGEMIGAVNMLVDITERKRAEDHQKTLIDELNHRVKNTLATVQSLVTQTAKHVDTVPEFTTSLKGRVMALSRAHELLADAKWERAGLTDMVKGVLEPFGTAVTAFGPDITLKPAVALSTTMVLHELATNSCKYGSLKAEGGLLSVRWGVVEDATGLVAKLVWHESQGPLVAQPTRSGFGTKLIKRLVASDLDGEVELDFRPEGLICRIEFPLTDSHHSRI